MGSANQPSQVTPKMRHEPPAGSITCISCCLPSRRSLLIQPRVPITHEQSPLPCKPATHSPGVPRTDRSLRPDWPWVWVWGSWLGITLLVQKASPPSSGSGPGPGPTDPNPQRWAVSVSFLPGQVISFLKASSGDSGEYGRIIR